MKEGQVATVELSLSVAAIFDCLSVSRERAERTGSVRSRPGTFLPHAILTLSSDRQAVEVDSSGRFGSNGCFQPSAADEVAVEAAGFGRQVVKARGVDPASVSWDLVLEYPPPVLAEMVRGFLPEIPTVVLWPGEVVVGVATTVGDFTVAVDTVRAPLTAGNFLKYVDAGLYEGGRFHRATRPDNYTPVLPNRPLMEIIQGGINPDRSAQGFPAIELERTSVTGIRHTAGTVSMARGTPDSATSDFFVLLDDQPSLDFGGKWFDDAQGAAAFGRLLTGLAVVRAIQWQPVQGQNLMPPVAIIAIKRAK